MYFFIGKMDVDGECAGTAGGGIDGQEHNMDFGDISRKIFSSCDVNNTNAVPVSNLIEYIKPYLVENLNALESLRKSLDPESSDTLVNQETFHEAMSRWSQTLANLSPNEPTERVKSPSRLTVIDDKDLPYVHSTPRTSLGDKPLKCKDLLDISNVSGYSLSTSRMENPESDKTVLEEEVKKLEHHLLKVNNELSLTKQQLVASEEQNDQLQQDLDRINRRLHAEQQVNDHLQKDIKYNEELRDELTNYKRNLEELKKKLSQSEKESSSHKNLLSKAEEEKATLEKRIETLSRQQQELKQALIDVNIEVEAKGEQLTDLTKQHNDLTQKCADQKDLIDHLREENDLLVQQKRSLERARKSQTFTNSSHPNLGNLLLFDLSETPSSPQRPTHTPSPQSGPQFKYQHNMPLLRKVLSRHSSTPIRTGGDSLIDDSPPSAIKCIPVLSPVRDADCGQQLGSSDEDISFKLLQGLNDQDLNGTTESLGTEMLKADPVQLDNATYETYLFEKEEYLIELEDETERLRVRIKEVEDQNQELTDELDKLKQTNLELNESNFVLMTKEEWAVSKIEALKKQAAQQEQNGIIAEEDPVLEDLRNKDAILEATLKDTQTALGLKADKVVTLEKEIRELREKLKNAESLKCDYDLKLQDVMRDLGEIATEKLALLERLAKLEKDNLNAEQQLSHVTEQLEKALEEQKATQEKQGTQLEEELFIAKDELDCSRSKCENMAQRISILEEELRDLRQLNGNTDEEVFCNRKFQKDLDEFKKNLEKKLVAEFESKVKRCMATEENILHLTQKSKKQEEEINELLQNVNCKSKLLGDTEKQLALLTSQNQLLQNELDSLKASKVELEAKVANLNGVIEEFKQLKANLNEAQLDLKKKNDSILELRDELTKFLDVKNELWKKGKDLEKDRNKKICEINDLEAHNQILKNSNKELDTKYNNLRTKYDIEVDNSAQHVAKCNELKAELDMVEWRITEETEKNQNFEKYIRELETKIQDLEATGQMLDVGTHDFTAQTSLDNISQFEDALSKAEKESNRLLDELETKLNKEVNMNKSLTSDLLELKDNYTKNNTQLNEMKLKLTDNEAEMSKKLQENCEKYDILTKEIDEAKECIHKKNIEISNIERELKQTKEALEESEDRNLVLNKAIKELEQALMENKHEAEQNIAEKDIGMSKIEKELTDTKETLEKELQIHITLLDQLGEKETTLQALNESYNSLDKELVQAKDIIKNKDIEISKITNELRQREESLLEELTKLNSAFKAKESDMEILKNKNKVVKEALDMIQLENNQLISELKHKLEETQEENQKLKRALADANIEVVRLKEWMSAQERNNFTLAKRIKEIQDEFAEKEHVTKQEKDELNQELVNLKRNLRDSETERNKTSRLLQEEVAKTKALFENFSIIRKERDSLSFELKEVKALYNNSQILYCKKQAELQERQKQCDLMELKVNSQAAELKQLEVQLRNYQTDIESITSQRDALISQLSSLKTSPGQKEKCDVDKELNKSRTYSRQQITIDKLKEKVEDLEGHLKAEKHKCQQLQNSLSLMEAEVTRTQELGQLQEEIVVQKELLGTLQRRHEEISGEVESLELKLAMPKNELGEMNGEAEGKRQIPGNVKDSKMTSEIGVQINASEESNVKSEGRPINKFTIASRSESPDSPCLDFESIGLAGLRNYAYSTKSTYSIPGDSVLEVPSLDVRGFADDIVDELDLNDSNPRKKLEREELESKVTALSLRLVVNASTITERIEKQTDRYRCQYEEILTLLSDISHRLRDHVCIGTSEPIGPVYVLLEEIKLQLRELVQNASQVGVLICEDKMKRCWNLVVNYVAMLREDNNIARDTTTTQTGLTRRRTRSTQDKPDLTAEPRRRRSRFGRCSKLGALLLAVVTFALAVSLVINVNCRMSVSEHQYCPLDGIVQRINVGFPPM